MTVVAMVVVAEGAAWLLAPDGPASEPEAVNEADYFEPAAIERARDYRGGQRALLFAGLAAQGVVLIALATGRPRAARAALERLGERPVLGAAAAGAGLSLTITLVGLPFDIAAHERSVDAGLSTQSLGAWLGDYGKGSAISAALAGAGAALLLALVRRFPRGWWAPAAAGVVAISVRVLLAGPGGPGAGVQQVRRTPRGQPAARRGPGARSRGRRGGRRGLPRGRLAPLDRAQRLRRRARADQAGRPLRQPDRLRRALGAAVGGRPRAGPRRQQRHPAGDRVHRDRRPTRPAVRA